MRVLMISKACLVGVYQRKLEELSAFPDIDLTVIVPPRWRDERGALELERAYTRGYELIVQPILFNGHFHLYFFPGLGRLMRALQPDIVHIDEEPYNLSTWQAVRAARAIAARTVFFTWQNLLRHYPPPFNWLETYVLKSVNYGIAGNQDAVTVWRRKGFRGPMKVIPQFGVDPELYPYRSSSSSLHQPFTIGYIGRLVPEKGVDLLLEAAAGLGGDWQIEILGSGPAKHDLEARASELGIAPRVHFHPLVPSTEVPTWMMRFDCLVLPSRTRPNWKEQFGRVLIEAMSCGVPVLGSACGEIPHVIGDAGLIFPEGDSARLRTSLLSLRDDPELRTKLAAAGRARVLAHYTQAQIAAATREVYLEMVSL